MPFNAPALTSTTSVSLRSSKMRRECAKKATVIDLESHTDLAHFEGNQGCSRPIAGMSSKIGVPSELEHIASAIHKNAL